MVIVGRSYMLITSGSSRVKWCWRRTERQSENWLPTTWQWEGIRTVLFKLKFYHGFMVHFHLVHFMQVWKIKFLYQFTHNIAQTYQEDISSKNSSFWPPLFPSRFCTHSTRPQSPPGNSGKKRSGHMRKWELA